jgi:hypothetical protein
MKHLITAYSLDDILHRWEEETDKENLRLVLLTEIFAENLKVIDPYIDMSVLDTKEEFLKENGEYGVCYSSYGGELIFKKKYWEAIRGFVLYGYAFKGSVPIQTVLENICVRKNDFLNWLKKTDQHLPNFWFSMKEKSENPTTEMRKRALAMSATMNDPEFQESMTVHLEEIESRRGVPIILHDWFKHDTWKQEEGLMLLSGLSPETLFDFDQNIYDEPIRIIKFLLTVDGFEGDPRSGSGHLRKLASYERLWESGNHPSRATPEYFISWALSKGSPPDWLDWAIENNYFNQSKLRTEKQVEGKSEPSYLNVIGALLGIILEKTDQNGKRYTNIANQETLITEIHNHFGDSEGLSKSNLQKKFPAAKRSINSK